MLDLDRFKQVNDSHGHAAGDAVIVAISQICLSLSRNGADLVGRLGGEEFAVLLPESTLEGARVFAERLRLVIETTPIFADINKINITASMGIASLDAEDNDITTIIKRADAALYASKNAGRNMVSAG
jgi:diguanylate cyclase (GGDEF)-like protein